MSATIIDGNLISGQIKQELAAKVSSLKEKGVTPCLAVILVGDDPASQVYVRNKEKACEQIGIKSLKYELPKETSLETLLNLINKLNRDQEVDGILVQLPLPKHINEQAVITAINPEKDVDGFHPVNVGGLVIGSATFWPCTPSGVIELLERYQLQIAGSRAVVVGRSNIVGKPVSLMLLHKDATVTVCHSKTKDLTEVTKQADILVAAIGKPQFIKAEMVKAGAVVIDVGVNRTEAGLVGDVDFAAVKEKARAITPVPGGVGPMTIAMLMKNTVKAASNRLEASQ